MYNFYCCFYLNYIRGLSICDSPMNHTIWFTIEFVIVLRLSNTKD